MIFTRIGRFHKYRQLIIGFACLCVLFFWRRSYRWKWKRNEEFLEIGERSWLKVPNFKVHDSPNGTWELYIFSAYFDTDENSKIVRIIATSPNTPDTKVICHFFGEERTPLSLANGVVRRLSNPADRPYRGGFVLCPLNSLEESQVFYISVSTEKHNPTTVPLLITRTPADSKPKHEFGLCLKPTFNYDSVFPFIQWVEFHKMMGVTHFTFYNLTMGPKASCALHTLLDPDSLTLLNGWGSASLIWYDPIIHSYAQLVQTADCNLRYRGRAKYYVSVDLDEYIVPNFTLAKDYGELMRIIGTVGKDETSPISQWIFRQAYFFPNSKINSNSPSVFPALEDLILYSGTTRHGYMEPHQFRSKYIADPWGLLEPGIHYAVNLFPPYTMTNVSVGIGYLHHYRKTPPVIMVPQALLQKHVNVEDTNARCIGDELLKRVTKSVKEVERRCNIKIDRTE